MVWLWVPSQRQLGGLMNHTKAGVGGTMAYMPNTVVAVCAAMGAMGKTCCTEHASGPILAWPGGWG